MSQTGLRKKINLNDNQMSDGDNKVTVHSLDNTSLLYIFDFLDIKEKLKISIVCKRWNEVGKGSWTQVKSLELNKMLPFKRYIDDEKKNKNTSILSNVLDRCCLYLNHITISINVKECTDFSQILNKILLCKNISSLKVIDCRYKRLFTEEDLNLLFKCFKNLKNICLNQLVMFGKNKSFQNITTNNIKKLILSDCEFEEESYIYKFLSNLKNLYEFEIHVEDDIIVGLVIDAISKSKCENLEIVSVSYYDSLADIDDHPKLKLKNLPLFLSRQKKMRTLKLANLLIDKKLITHIPTDCLENIYLHLCHFGSAKTCLNFFQHCSKMLSHLSWTSLSFDNNCLKAVCECVNLKLLKIDSNYKSAFKETSVNCLSKLAILETLKLKNDMGEKSNIRNLLKGLNKCPSLKFLKLGRLKLKNEDLQIISSLIDLTGLNIKDELKDENFHILLEKLFNLKELSVACESVTSNLINIASEIKKKRGDDQILKIIFNFYKYDNLNEIMNLPPLVKISIKTHPWYIQRF